MGVWAGWMAVAGVPDEVFGRGDRAVLHRVLGRIPSRLRGQYIGGAGGVQEREDAVITHQHIHRQPSRGRSAGHRRMRTIHSDRQHYAR